MSQNRLPAKNDPCISDYMRLANDNPSCHRQKTTSIKGERGGNLKCLRVVWCENFPPTTMHLY